MKMSNFPPFFFFFYLLSHGRLCPGWATFFFFIDVTWCDRVPHEDIGRPVYRHRICAEKDERRFRRRLNRLESCKGITGVQCRELAVVRSIRLVAPYVFFPVVKCIQLLLSEVGRFSKSCTSCKSSLFDIVTIKQLMILMLYLSSFLWKSVLNVKL